MTSTVNMPVSCTSKIKRIIFRLMSVLSMFMIFTLSVSASGTSSAGTTASAITDVGTALTGVIGYMAQTTAAILGDDLWILGMGFFVLSFVAGFVMYLFRVGRR